MVTLSSCLIWQRIRFILPPNEYGWTMLVEQSLRSTYRRCRFWEKNHLFRWRTFWSWLVCKQAKLSHLGHRKPERIQNKTQAKRVTVWCGFWSRGIIGPFSFGNEQGKSVTVNGNRYRLLNEFLFTKIEEEDIANIWFQQDGTKCHTDEAKLDVLRPVFEDRLISSKTEPLATS